jgi:hypothetical protein
MVATTEPGCPDDANEHEGLLWKPEQRAEPGPVGSLS